MSIIGKKPYIHSILSALSANGLSRLQTLVDSIDFNNGIQVRLSRLSSDLTAGSTGNEYHVWFVQLAFDDYNGKVAKGFLIENASASHEFGFFSFQKNVEAMASYKISSPSGLDGSFSYEDMHENLHAEEFRRCLDDYLEQEVPDMKVTAGIIDSGNTALGKVLTANGQGGAIWADNGNGDVKRYEVESIGDISNFLNSEEGANLKLGDILYDNANVNGGSAGFVSFADDYTVATINVYDDTFIAVNYYSKEDDEWKWNEELSYDFSKNSIGGTKLYKHSIVAEDEGQNHWEFSFIAPLSTPLTLDGDEYSGYVGENLICVSLETSGDVWIESPYSINWDSQGGNLNIDTANNTYTLSPETLTDTVEEL